MIKFLARDDETGRICTYQTVFVIPNLNKEDKRIPISSIVLSSQRVDLKEALFDVEKGARKEKQEVVNPLVANGKKLVPSVTRVFSTSKEMYVYLQAYKPLLEGSQPANQPLFAFVSLYLGDKRAFETPPDAVIPNASSRLGTMPLSFSFSHVAPGDYDCQVTILDYQHESKQ
jgi:hypothetical protein